MTINLWMLLFPASTTVLTFQVKIMTVSMATGYNRGGPPSGQPNSTNTQNTVGLFPTFQRICI